MTTPFSIHSLPSLVGSETGRREPESPGPSTLTHPPTPPETQLIQALPPQTFIAQLLAADADAAVIAAGDFNEYQYVAPMTDFAAGSGLAEADDAADVAAAEQYSYVYDMNSEQLDHVLVSPRLVDASSSLAFAHVHVNTWVPYADQASDHDPSVAKFDVCRS